MNNITGILLDVQKNCLSAVTVPDKLESYYELLNCDCIDIIVRKIDGRYFNIVCDDEARLKEHPILSAVSLTEERGDLYGSLFVVGQTDDDGNLTSLTDMDVEYIMNYAPGGIYWESEDTTNPPRQCIPIDY